MQVTITRINCIFPTQHSLYQAYMPFIIGSGLFIQTNELQALESPVYLSIQLFDEKTPVEATGKVVWVTPPGAQDNKPTGIGVQFTGDNKQFLCEKIENYLAGMLHSNQPTDTI